MGSLNFLTGRSPSPYSGTTTESPYLSSCFGRISPARIRMAEGSPLISPKSGERLCRVSVDFLNVLPRRSLSPYTDKITASTCLSSNFSLGPPFEEFGRFHMSDISVHRSSLGCHPVMAALQDGPSSSSSLGCKKRSSVSPPRRRSE